MVSKIRVLKLLVYKQKVEVVFKEGLLHPS